MIIFFGSRIWFSDPTKRGIHKSHLLWFYNSHASEKSSTCSPFVSPAGPSSAHRRAPHPNHQQPYVLPAGQPQPVAWEETAEGWDWQRCERRRRRRRWRGRRRCGGGGGRCGGGGGDVEKEEEQQTHFSLIPLHVKISDKTSKFLININFTKTYLLSLSSLLPQQTVKIPTNIPNCRDCFRKQIIVQLTHETKHKFW